MTFNEILQSDVASAEKLTQLSKLVSDIRKAYGNADLDIPSDYVNTPDGMVQFKYLDADSKVAFAGNQIRAITIEAIEAVEVTPGTVLDKELESLIATDPILCNLASSSGSKYI